MKECTRMHNGVESPDCYFLDTSKTVSSVQCLCARYVVERKALQTVVCCSKSRPFSEWIAGTSPDVDNYRLATEAMLEIVGRNRCVL